MVVSDQYDYYSYDMDYTDSKKEKKENIRVYKIKKDNCLKFLPRGTWITYVIEGQLKFSYGEHTDKKLNKGQMALFLSGYQTVVCTEADAHILVIKISDQVQLYDCFTSSTLFEKSGDKLHTLTLLEANTIISNYMLVLDTYINEGIGHNDLFEYKIKEFFYLLQQYYSKDELFDFFYFYLTNDIGFSNMVKAYSYKVKTVQELADLTNYSLSGFHKRFKRVFGISAYQWMTEQRSKNILHEIISTTKSLKEISDEYEFSSPSHFNDFCKKHYKITPGSIRRKRKDNIS